MGLRAAPGGFGTPEFDGRVARVEGNILVYEQEELIATRTITTIREAAQFYGEGYEVEWYPDFHGPPNPMDPDTNLEVGEETSRALGLWFNFGFEVLDELRSRVKENPSETQLWPEHFDAALELGNDDAGRRAAYGASPGDAGHAFPYLYVSPWSGVDRANPYWNDPVFDGSSLGYEDLLVARDPVDRALDFLLAGYRALHPR